MSDVTGALSSEEIAELCALADGTLPAERRAEVEARAAASPDLRELLERQREAVRAAQTLVTDEVPESLRTSVEKSRRAAGSRTARDHRFVPRIALAVGAAVAAVIVSATLLSRGPGAPTIADAARLGTQAPTAAAPAAGGTRLAEAVQGVAFPNPASWSDWRAVGVRRGRIEGRDATAVFYRKDGRKLAYVIVAGPGLDRPSGAQARWIRGVEYQVFRSNGRLLVTWRRGGHTCVLLGQASRAELLKFASWPLTPPR